MNQSEDDDSLVAPGAAYVFRRNDTVWSQQAYIKASNTDAGDRFGEAVALSGDGKVLAVGARGEAGSGNSAGNSGAVYVFNDNPGWSQQAYLKASNADPGDYFGYSIALNKDGSALAVAATGEASSAIGIDGDQNDNSDPAGAVYVFNRTGMTWSQQAYIKASNTNAQDRFGSSLSLSDDGDLLAVGATGESSNATSVDGNQNDNSLARSGAAYLFARNGSAWSQQAYLKASNPDSEDGFGASLSLAGDGSTLVVGAYIEASNATGVDGDQNDNSRLAAGAAYVFRWSETAWQPQAYIKSSTAGTLGLLFGYSVDLNGDGSILAAGAQSEANASGALYLY